MRGVVRYGSRDRSRVSCGSSSDCSSLRVLDSTDSSSEIVLLSDSSSESVCFELQNGIGDCSKSMRSFLSESNSGVEVLKKEGGLRGLLGPEVC